MKRKIVYLIAAFSLLTGCVNMAEMHKRANSWIANHAGVPQINIEGRWDSSSWGYVRLKQKGNRISGILGDYIVRGSVNGKVIHMGIYYNRDLYYTATLTMQEEGLLLGQYYSYMKHSNGGNQMLLRRFK